MDPSAEYVGEENKYGVTKSVDESHVNEDTTPVETHTQTESRGMFGFGGKSDPSEEQSTMVTESQGAPVGGGATAATGTDYSMDSIDGGNPTGGTNYSAATLDGAGNAAGGTDYSGASVMGGNPTGGTDYSGVDLSESTTATS